MTDLEKKQEILNYLDENIWNEAIRVGKENNDKVLVQGVKLTKIRMSQRPTAVDVLHYFWSAIQGTDKSISFSEKMKEYGLTRFEDVLEDVRVKFDDNWLRG